MSAAIHKVIEVLTGSTKSWEDAADLAVKDAAKSLKGIKSIYIKNFQGDIKITRLCNTALMLRSLSKSAAERRWPAVVVILSNFSHHDGVGADHLVRLELIWPRTQELYKEN